ncbi:lipase [Leptospira gomenensis]|uniref:Lipase n=1 Tax=Leptospira gomenensis TaxID=2484974 RepID=A0A5F1YE60_9LEPT|nr:lipase [Leptospira gomenensis]TGK37441.1 lipase [Leptospira gomenensis]TGK40800.1 lipase [Leptospira gomenensis]TGK43026.1 lipase [Leptospira gomenensis]TGK54274.1 lipase [Leptospira gomenensis]
MKGFFSWAGRGLLFFFVVFVGTEVLLSVLRAPSLQYYRDQKILHRYNPIYYVDLEPKQDIYIRHHAGKWEGRFRTNSLGLRGIEEPDDDKPKLACLGDSLVMGFGVSDEDTFCHQLNGIELKGRARQSLNLAVDAYGSSGALRRLKDLSPRLKNLKEVLFFVSANDFTLPEELRAKGMLSDDEVDEIRDKDPSFNRNFRIQFELSRVSYTLLALKLAYEQLKVQYAFARDKVRVEWESTGFSSSSGAEQTPAKYMKDSFFRSPPSKNCSAPGTTFEKLNVVSVLPPTPETMDLTDYKAKFCPEPIPDYFVCQKKEPSLSSLEPLPKITRAAYDEMVRFTRENGIRLVVVLMPVQVEEIYCRNRGMYHPLENYALRAGDYFEKKGVPVLRLRTEAAEMCGEILETPFGKKFSGIRDYFIPGDGHLTVPGNNWAKRALIKQLKELDTKNAL